jgi:hypothetical protein
MKIIHKNTAAFALPLPIYTFINLADAIARDGEEFDVFVGLPKKYVEELQRLSTDPTDADLQKNTDDRLRFGGAYEEWYHDHKVLFALIHKRTDSLAALAWLEPVTYRDIIFHALSVRSYPLFRGKGIIKNFLRYILEIYKEHFPKVQFSAGVPANSNRIIRILSEIGFERDEENSDLVNNWLVMVQK